MDMKLIFSATLVYTTLSLFVIAEFVEDKQALIDFMRNVNHSRSLNWDQNTSACNSWIGVTCNHGNSRIIAVRLPGIGLKGSFPNNTLSRLSALQILSLRSNGFSGPFPSDLLNLGNLTGLYLEFNKFDGPLPLNFSAWRNLSILNLSNNGFNGSVPWSISNLTSLIALDLSNNLLSGDIQNLEIPSLKVLNLSNNNLTGVVPRSLVRFPSSAFSGNNISRTDSSTPAPQTIDRDEKHSSKLSESAILGIVIGSCILAFVSVALVLLAMNRKRKRDDNAANTATPQRKEKSMKISGSQHRDGSGRITFFEGCDLVFDLEDLLRASAEVLGKGNFGTTYRASLEDGNIVAVKRLKEVLIGRKEFEQQMVIVGNIRHNNVAPLRAYYYSKDEKLMVYDYYNLGSASALLHARGGNRIPLDWETRIKIAIGAARGIAHIHSQGSGKLVHGNIKASNIFLHSQHYGCISDLGLATLISPSTQSAARAAGYQAPEIIDSRKASQASDVYSFGVFLLELVTGKSPVHAPGSEEVVHLVRWVNSVVREEWTGEVFDVELLRYANIEEEMVAMLQLGLSCVARMPEQRPKMVQVVKMVEEIRGANTENSPSVGTRSTPGSTAAVTPNMGEIGSSSGKN